MFAIYKKELKTYFCSFIGLLFIAVTLFYVSLYFYVYNMYGGSPYFTYAMSNVVLLFLISVPVLSMRILAEERRSRTDQLILTAPVSVGGIVLGKFLALMTIFLIPCAVICTYPLIMSLSGSVPLGEAYLAILGFFLYGMAAISIGILISSLTESQVISAVLTFLALFLGYMISSICSVVFSTDNWLYTLLCCFDMYTPFSNLLNGTLDLSSVVYFVSLSALALFLTVQSIQKRRYNVSVKSFRLGAYSLGSTLAAVAVTIAVNIVMGELPRSWTSLDMTAQKLYSLTDQTREYVDSMQEDVDIYVIVAQDNCDTVLDQTLQRYDDLSDHITVQYVDPNQNPRFHTQYTSANISLNSLIVVSDKRSRVIDYSEIYEADYEYDYSTGGYSATTTGYDGEGQITSALDYVLSDDMPKIYLLEGHGEYALSSGFTTALERENVEYETINLIDYETVPEDAACLLINAPVRDLSNEDRDKVLDYLNAGGDIVFVAGMTQEATPNLDQLLEEMGLRLTDGLIVESDADRYYATPYWLLPVQSYSGYLDGVYGDYYVFAPYAQGIVIEDEAAEGISYDTFLSTSDSAYSKIDLASESYEKEEGDIDGPFAVAVAAEKETEEGNAATMVVIGCEQFFTDEANEIVSGANQMVFTNIIGSFADHEISVSIPAKSYEVSALVVTRARAVLVGAVTILVIPAGCLLAGFVIWFRRRRL